MPLTCSHLEQLQEAECVSVGNKITSKQPDTEVLAMLLKDIPTTTAQFEEQRGDRPFVSMSIMIVAVGNAGFSSVPYVANAKPGTIQHTKKLYEDIADGRVVCYPFQKGRTNKDKGDRVERFVDDATNEQVDAGTPLHAGLYLTNFLREESFGDNGKFFTNMDGSEDLKAGSFLYVQIAASNVEQAQKGHFFKFKKCMPARYVDSMVHKVSLSQIPRSMQEFENSIATSKNTVAISKQVYGSNAKIFSTVPARDSYAVMETDKNRFIIVEAAHDIADIEVSQDMVLKAAGCTNMATAHKVLSLALSAGAVHTIVSYNKQGTLLLSHDCDAKALWLYIDFRKLLDLSKLCYHGLNPGFKLHDKFLTFVTDDCIVWMDQEQTFKKSQHETVYVCYCLSRHEQVWTKDDENDDDIPNTQYTTGLITSNVAGPYYPLSICFLPCSDNQDFSSLLSQIGQADTHDDLEDVFCRLQFNEKNLKEADCSGLKMGVKKRKRPSFESV